MKKEEFINILKDTLEVEDDKIIKPETRLKDIDTFDSLSVFVIIAMVDKHFDRHILSSDFDKLTTIDSLMELIGKEYFK